MTNKRSKGLPRNKTKMIDNHEEFLGRINKTLYYGRLPKIPCLSLPVTELSSDLFSEAQRGKSLKRLHVEDAAELSRNACVSPCSLVLALLYLERLKTSNPEYLSKIAPSDLFLVTLMVSNKFLQDDGEEDEVFCNEWATSGGITLQTLHQLEWEFLDAIDWRVFVGKQDFESGLDWLEHRIAMQQAKVRGWFTYSDLVNISTKFENIGLMKCLVTVYLALSISYVASVLTLIASSYIVSQGNLIVKDLTNSHHKEFHKCIAPSLMNTSVDNNLDDTTVLEDSEIDNILNNSFCDDLADANVTMDRELLTLPSITYSNMWLSLWQNLVQIELANLTPNFLSKYLISRNQCNNEDSLFSLNGIYLNQRYSSNGWYEKEYGYSLTLQYPASVG